MKYDSTARLRNRRIIAAALLFAAGFIVPSAADERTFSRDELDLYRVQVYPVLKRSCFKCHGGGKHLKSNFRITSREGLIRGGDRGPSVHLTEPKKSVLLHLVSYADPEDNMPPSGKLEDSEITLLTHWIETGAPYDPDLEIHGDPSAEGHDDPTQVNEKTKNFWAFRKIDPGKVPSVRDPQWQKSPIDAYIYAAVEAAGLRPNAPASKQALIRRAYYDLTGLPPTPAEVSAFVADASPQAFERVVDHLLDSPHYGEKWGRHWLDLVRYAESNGYERDSVKPMAWGYRDYVIRAFNDDKPYDRFLTEQLAGDEFDAPDADSIAATGYYRLGLWDDEPADPPLARYDYLDSVAATTGEAMLGLTIGCARCHDHKIDPIPAKDYYSFLAFFQNLSPHGKGKTNLVSVTSKEGRERFEAEKAKKSAAEAQKHQRIFEIEQRYLKTLQKKNPEAADLGSSDLVELRYRFYRDTWNRLPIFDDLRPETEGSITDNRLSLEPALRKDAMGLVFDGKLRVPSDGRYRFFVETNDGSRLLLGGKTVAERDGRGAQTYDATVPLKEGYVPFRFEYFSRSSSPRLRLRWQADGEEARALSRESTSRVLLSDARSSAPEWRYTFSRPGENWATHEFDAGAWKKGAGGFGTQGTPGAVVRTTWSTSDIWMRRDFEVRGGVEKLTLALHHDENAEVYVNGKLVHRVKGYIQKYEDIELGKEATDALREGRNVVAVHCHQTGGGQYIDVGLKQGKAPERVSERIAADGDALLGKPVRDEYFRLRRELEESLKKEVKPAESRSFMAVAERGRSKTYILRRGNPSLAGEEVQPGFPSVLSPPEPKISERRGSSGRRTALAEWICSSTNPLPARVIANRLWQFHFGRGIVPTPSDFGRIGEAPTHPKLLDWLAADLRDNGWRLKRAHKQIMLSQAYQMSSEGRADALAKDPSNRLFWRFNPRRLTAEEIRDTMLLVSGQLNKKMGGTECVSGTSRRSSGHVVHWSRQMGPLASRGAAPTQRPTCSFGVRCRTRC